MCNTVYCGLININIKTDVQENVQIGCTGYVHIVYSHAIPLSIMHSNKCNLTVLLHIYPISNEQKSARNTSIRR